MSLPGYHDKLLHSLIQPYPRFPMILSVSECVRNVFQNTFIMATENTLDIDWIDSCNLYVDSLSLSDKYIIRSYTYHGDELVNLLLRNDMSTNSNTIFKVFNVYGLSPIAMQIFTMYNINADELIDSNNELNENGERILAKITHEHKLLKNYELLIKLLKNYSAQLMSIIAHGPKLNKPILTFRGVKKDYIKSSDTPLTFTGFQSSSYIPDVAEKFMECCLYEIIVTPDTPCLAIQNAARMRKEYEILLGHDTMAIISDLKSKPFFDSSMLLYNSNGSSHKFENPTNILQKIFDPYNAVEMANVRRIITTRSHGRFEYPKLLKIYHRNKTLKIKRGGNREIILENGVVVKTLERELMEDEKQSFRIAFDAFGMKYPKCLDS